MLLWPFATETARLPHPSGLLLLKYIYSNTSRILFRFDSRIVIPAFLGLQKQLQKRKKKRKKNWKKKKEEEENHGERKGLATD